MRKIRLLVVASGLAGTSALLSMSGCQQVESDCKNGSSCGAFDPPGTIIVKSACPGDPTTRPDLITADCALFVRGAPTDTDVGAGTPEKPFKTLQAAIIADNDADKQKWIIACTANSFNEKVTIVENGIAIYGGFDCANGWAWKPGTKTSLTGPADAVAMTITGNGVKVQDFKIQAADATIQGLSSVAVTVSGAQAAFIRCDMIAGKAQDGLAGDGIMPDQANAGSTGKNGGDACSSEPVLGPSGAGTTCGSVSSIGGQGGNGTKNGGTDSNGKPGDPSTSGGGQPGQGETAIACTPGQDGALGESGQPGSGAPADQAGALDIESFYPVPGGKGEPGKPGQGGGGGGGAKGAACTNGKLGGASGGSGASGGCGGLGGNGGLGAGASIALVSIATTEMSLADVTLTAQNGAKGGAGGDAQKGGAGGTTGGLGGNTGSFLGLSEGCPGGRGGAGGQGGNGGGGRGGHSIGLAYTGTQPALGTTKVTVGMPGPGGDGGKGGFDNNAGAPGIAAPSQAFNAAEK